MKLFKEIIMLVLFGMCGHVFGMNEKNSESQLNQKSLLTLENILKS